MNLKFWKKKPQAEPDRPYRLTIPVDEITLREWQGMGGSVESARVLMQSTTFQHMLGVLKTESPANYALPAMGATDIDCAKWLGRIEGYALALNNLAALGRHSALTEMPAPTFESPEQQP
jgi:hypothetical protein